MESSTLSSSVTPKPSNETHDGGKQKKAPAPAPPRRTGSESEIPLPAPNDQAEKKVLSEKRNAVQGLINELKEAADRPLADLECEFQILEEEDRTARSINKMAVYKGAEPKNRYPDIVPYEKYAVKLVGPTDYINASMINELLPGSPPFIATQGPMPTTSQDFWTMVLQQDCRVIVMVTNIVESDQIKCVQYWPTELSKPVEYPATAAYPYSVEVSLINESLGVAWARRVFSVKQISGDIIKRRDVVQYHFIDWPDYGTPESPYNFMMFVRMVIAEQNKAPKKSPVVVHCSAGVGRTGTFMGLYAVLTALKHAGDKLEGIMIEQLIRKMRCHRPYMVASFSQFKFLHDTVHQAAQCYFNVALGIDAPFYEDEVELRINGDRSKEYDAFVHCITAPNLLLIQSVNSFLAHTDLDAFTTAIINTFGACGLLLPLVARVSEWEVAACPSAKVLFRKNSLATKVITAALNLYGKSYLVDTLRPVLDAMLETPDVSYEINPTKIPIGQNMGENRDRVKRLSEKFLSAIIATLAGFPPALSLVLSCVASATAKRFPQAVLNAVAGSFVLRFVGPAIVTPKIHGIVSEPLPVAVEHGLLLASKVLQAIANTSEFTGFRETHMQVIDSFVKLAIPRGEEFLRKISTCPKFLDVLTLKKFAEYNVEVHAKPTEFFDASIVGANKDGILGAGLTSADFVYLHKYIASNKEKIDKFYLDKARDIELDNVNAVLEGIGFPEMIVRPPEAWVKLRTKVDLKNRSSNATHLATQEIGALVSLYYPSTNIKRGAVSKPNWETIDKGYHPVEYTNPDLPEETSDPDIRRHSALLIFNDYDVKFKVDRRSYVSAYKIVDGVPRNPVKRTGVIGRGNLPRWGPNHLVYPIITRWFRQNDEVQMRSGQPVLEFLAKRMNDPEELFAIPTGIPSSRNLITPEIEQLMKQVRVERRDSNSNGGGQFSSSIEAIFENGTILHQGYFDDDANTDNAWFETFILNYHDDGKTFSSIPQHIMKAVGMEWVPVHEELEINHDSKQYIKRVALLRKAYYADRLSTVLSTIVPLIELRGMNTEGIYRVCGSLMKVHALKEKCLNDPSFDLSSVVDVNELSGLLKLLLREMNPPLMTYFFYTELIAVDSLKDDVPRYEALAKVLHKLPSSTFGKVRDLILHLKRVVANEEINKMGASNLSLVFGPTIIRSPQGLAGDLCDSGRQIKVCKSMILMPGELWNKSFFANGGSVAELLEQYKDQLDEETTEPPAAAVHRTTSVPSEHDDASSEGPTLDDIMSNRVDISSVYTPSVNEPVKELVLDEEEMEAIANVPLRNKARGSMERRSRSAAARSNNYRSMVLENSLIVAERRASVELLANDELINELTPDPVPALKSSSNNEAFNTPATYEKEVQDGHDIEEVEESKVAKYAFLGVDCSDEADEDELPTWYRSVASRDELRALRQEPKGIFIIHDSKTQDNCFCLSVATGDGMHTSLIVANEDGYFVEEGPDDLFPTLSELVEYYSDEECPGPNVRLVVKPRGVSSTSQQENEKSNHLQENAQTSSSSTTNSSSSPLPNSNKKESVDKSAVPEIKVNQKIQSTEKPTNGAQEEAYEGSEGYYDEDGNWVEGDGYGYYDEDGNWVEEAYGGGYYDEDGNWIEGEGDGNGEEEVLDDYVSIANSHNSNEEASTGSKSSSLVAQNSPGTSFERTKSRRARRLNEIGEDDIKLMAIPTHSRTASMKKKVHLTFVEIRKAGFLMFHLEGKKEWKKRWCVLQDTMFKYYKSKPSSDSQTAVGYANISAACSLRELGDGVFMLVLPERTNFVFQAKTEDERKEWVTLFQSACSLSRQESKSLSSGNNSSA